MLFYKIEGSLVKNDAENEDSRKAHRANVRRIAIKSDEFNEKFCRDSFFFVSNSSDGILTVGVIAERQGKIRETLKAYLKHIECELADIVVTEITFNSIQNLLCSADRQDYIADDDEVMEKYGLDKISGRRGRSIDFGENIIDERSQSEVFSNAEKYLLNKTFLPELGRIYAGGASSKPYGHPVHYILQTDDRDTRREAY
ncbi:MAG: hypothetical protein II220_11295, partial [Spirochaetales bacterium]|nr:hypothetical protein [Spirochaetales bacterium]